MSAIIEVKDLTVAFHTRNGVVRAVDGVSFRVEAGQTVGIVGESGSGKSVTCYSLLGLIPQPPGRIEGGSAIFGNQDLLKLSEKELQKVRGSRISMIFQDPMTSLNPFLKVGTQLVEPLRTHEGLDKTAAWKKGIEALAEVGIPDPATRMDQYPHEFSGGMRQRVMIAMALITRPQLLIADEPTTALDVTIQQQVLDLIKDLQKRLGIAVVFITHDLAVVHEICDVVNVMYAGRLVESASAADLFAHPRHAYTRALMRSIPALQKKGQPLYTIAGLPPDLSQLPDGCAFRPRQTPDRQALCLSTQKPPLIEIASGHWVQACPGCVEGGLPL
jgi:oligopeptide transport system ATP-binding protein